MTEWQVETQTGTVGELHRLGLGDEPRRLIRRCVPTDSALVLGKSQPESDVDLAALRKADVSLVRRSSGGGAVLVQPDVSLWVDVVIPTGDPLWSDDVGHAFMWLGQIWREVLESLGIAAVVVHDGAMIKSEFSKMICFAGLGPGECLAGGLKVMGISQRRVRAGALFQCSVLLRPSIIQILDFLVLSKDQRVDARNALEKSVGHVDVDPDRLYAHFLRSFG